MHALYDYTSVKKILKCAGPQVVPTNMQKNINNNLRSLNLYSFDLVCWSISGQSWLTCLAGPLTTWVAKRRRPVSSSGDQWRQRTFLSEPNCKIWSVQRMILHVLYLDELHSDTTKAFGWAKNWMSIHLPFKTRCKLLASTDNWKASKATVSGFNSMYADKCYGRMTQTTCTFHSKLSSWHIMMIARAKKLLYKFVGVPFFWKETGRLEGSGRKRPLECGVQLSLRVGIWCLFSHRQVSTFIITAASKILRDLMDLLLNFCHHLRLALSPIFEIGVPLYHHTWKQYLLDISKGAKMGHVWKGPHNPSVTIF